MNYGNIVKKGETFLIDVIVSFLLVQNLVRYHASSIQFDMTYLLSPLSLRQNESLPH